MIEAAILTLAVAAMQPAVDPKPQDTRLMSYVDPQKWRFRAVLGVTNGSRRPQTTAEQKRNPGRPSMRPKEREKLRWNLTSCVLAVPIIERAGGAIMLEEPEKFFYASNSFDWLGGEMDIESRETSKHHRGTVGGFPTRYFLWKGGTGKYVSVLAGYETNYICYETEFNEELAGQLAWPSAWPAEAKPWLEPEPYVSTKPDGTEFDDASLVTGLLDKWTNGQSPKAIPPLQLAKWLAGSVQEYVRSTGKGMSARRDLAAKGFAISEHYDLDVRTAEQIVEDPKGSPHDATILLTAIYREAGIPARMVFGFAKSRGRGVRNPSSQADSIKSWVEFAMYDEQARELTWVPVDVVRMRKNSSRMHPMNQPWKFFGTHEGLDTVVPFAFHLTPPINSDLDGPPGFAGFSAEPEYPDQILYNFTFVIDKPPVQAGD